MHLKHLDRLGSAVPADQTAADDGDGMKKLSNERLNENAMICWAFTAYDRENSGRSLGQDPPPGIAFFGNLASLCPVLSDGRVATGSG